MFKQYVIPTGGFKNLKTSSPRSDLGRAECTLSRSCQWSWGHPAPLKVGLTRKSIAHWEWHPEWLVLQQVIFSASQGHRGLPGLRGPTGQQGPPVSVSNKWDFSIGYWKCVFMCIQFVLFIYLIYALSKGRARWIGRARAKRRKRFRSK